ncbi:DUF1648 domain-containing protein [Spirosoma koreense]
MSTYVRNANYLTIGLFVLLTGISIAGAVFLPVPVAIHYNLAGKPDRWGSPASLLILPVIVFFLLGIIWATDRAHPDLMNFPGPRTPENVPRQLRNTRLMNATMRVYLTFMFLIIQSQSIWAKFYNRDQLIGWTLPVFMVSLFLIIGFFVRRAYKLVPRQ